MTGEKISKNTILQLERELRQRNAELAIINALQSALAAELDIHGIYDVVGEKLREIFSTHTLAIYSADLKSRTVRWEYDVEKGQKFPPMDLPFNSLFEYVLNLDTTFVINGDFPQFAAKFEDYKVLGNVIPKSVLVTPVIKRKESNQVVSICLFDIDSGKIFTETDIRLVETVANAMSVALENARLFDQTQRLLKETEQRNAELAIINSVQEGLASKLNMQAIYELVGEKIRETFNAQIVNIATYDRATNLMEGRYFFEDGWLLPGITLPAFGFRKYVLENQKPIVINEDMSHWMEVYDNPVLQGVQPKSAIFVPMIAGAEAIGVISLQNINQENAFSEADLRLLTTLSNSMSVALENARLFDETQRLLKEMEQRNAELAIINSVQEGLASKLAIQAIYDLVGDRLRDVFHNKDVEIRIYDANTKMIHNPYTCESGKRITIRSFALPERGFGPHVLHTLENLVINENLAQEMEKYGSKIVAGTLMAKSLMMVPLVMNNHAHGLITISDMQYEHAFKGSDVRLLRTLANSMSVALENARLWEEEKLYRRALERELEIGREIQAGFLPETLPQVDGWEIAAALMSAREVAGDFYDAFELPDGNIGLVIADVCDKGVGAALFMTLFRSLIRVTSNLEHIEHAGLPHSTPERLKRAMILTNNYIAETHGDSGMFATLFFGILDPYDGKLTYINGGHEPPLIVRAGVVRETLYKTGPAVGVVMDCPFDLFETQLNTGDTFFAFTDGVPDCKDPSGEFYGRERLLDILHQSDESVPDLVGIIETELRQYIASATQFDDITLLAVRRLGT
jgi:serine phosphatase RsbU (regulator of sigma subunit)